MEIENAAPAAAEAAVAETPVAESQPSEAALEPSPRSSIDNAFDKVFSDDGEDAGESEAKPERARGPDGKFVAKQEQGEAEGAEQETTGEPANNDPFANPPDRFSQDAKAAWKDVPLPVKAEMNRAMTEMANGIAWYQQTFEPYKELDRQLKTNGQSFEEVVGHYAGMERLLQQDPISGLSQICGNLGLRLEDVAAYVLQQPAPPMGQPDHRDHVINDLRGQIQMMQDHLQQFTGSIQQERTAEAQRIVTEFAKDHPRLDELGQDIAWLISAGRAQTLEQAYEMAERLNPAPSQPNPEPVRQPQTRRGQSLSGAPAGGSNPQRKNAPASVRSAIDNAFASAGL